VLAFFLKKPLTEKLSQTSLPIIPISFLIPPGYRFIPLDYRFIPLVCDFIPLVCDFIPLCNNYLLEFI